MKVDQILRQQQQHPFHPSSPQPMLPPPAHISYPVSAQSVIEAAHAASRSLHPQRPGSPPGSPGSYLSSPSEHQSPISTPLNSDDDAWELSSTPSLAPQTPQDSSLETLASVADVELAAAAAAAQSRATSPISPPVSPPLAAVIMDEDEETTIQRFCDYILPRLSTPKGRKVSDKTLALCIELIRWIYRDFRDCFDPPPKSSGRQLFQVSAGNGGGEDEDLAGPGRKKRFKGHLSLPR